MTLDDAGMARGDPVILITGSSRGLGAHAAVRFAERGWRVVVDYARPQSRAEAEAVVARARDAARAGRAEGAGRADDQGGVGRAGSQDDRGDDPADRVLVCRADVSDPAAVQALYDTVYGTRGRFRLSHSRNVTCVHGTPEPNSSPDASGSWEPSRPESGRLSA